MGKVVQIGCGYWGKNWYKTIMNSKYELEVMGKKVKAKPFIKALYDSNRQQIFL